MAKTPATRPGNPGGVPANRPRGFGATPPAPAPEPEPEVEEHHDQGDDQTEHAEHAEHGGRPVHGSTEQLAGALAGPIGGALFAAFVEALIKALAELFGTTDQQMRSALRSLRDQ